MYVCICNAVTEKDIRDAVDEGAISFCQLEQKLGVSTCCGNCVVETRDCLKKALVKLEPDASTLAA